MKNKTTAMNTETKLEARQLRAWEMLASNRCDIMLLGEDDKSYLVRSQSTTGYYEVRKQQDSRWACECADYTNRKLPCKHIYAVRFRTDQN